MLYLKKKINSKEIHYQWNRIIKKKYKNELSKLLFLLKIIFFQIIIDFETQNTDDSEVIEFGNESNTETYAKIGSIDGSSGLFVDNIYDLNGNVLFQLDSSNNILIIKGIKYKMIPYIET